METDLFKREVLHSSHPRRLRDRESFAVRLFNKYSSCEKLKCISKFQQSTRCVQVCFFSFDISLFFCFINGYYFILLFLFEILFFCLIFALDRRMRKGAHNKSSDGEWYIFSMVLCRRKPLVSANNFPSNAGISRIQTGFGNAYEVEANIFPKAYQVIQRF